MTLFNKINENHLRKGEMGERIRNVKRSIWWTIRSQENNLWNQSIDPDNFLERLSV